MKAPSHPPTVKQSPANPVKEKDNITLTCEVSGGIPLAAVSLDCGKTLSYNTDSTKASHSVYFEVSKEDNGRICNCSAMHPVAEYKPIIQHQIVVYYIPDTLLAITMIPDRIIDIGDNITLSCTVEGGNPSPTLKWDCGDDVTYNLGILGNKTTSSIHFEVDKYDNGKNCSCSAFHPISTYNHTRQHSITVYCE
ncbi:Hypothetical predicted protein [Mytilus galloprovincialis]|uniref:Ig-like domain-containing protein n=1 Tax=Mytilus galloprovincialis TaxID=29158 RepID=A0A8B6HIR0_MYTGA|nr:Hypothetical predicted protein [Mytilus galloprovincialis]